MITGGHIALDFICLVQSTFQKGRCNFTGVNRLARQGKAWVRDDVENGVFVLIRCTAIASIDIVDEPFVERPGVHLALPVIDDRIAETVNFGLLVRHSGREPCGFCGLLGCRRLHVNESFDGRQQSLGSCKTVFVFRQCDVCVVIQYRGFISDRRCGDKKRGSKRARHKMFHFSIPFLAGRVKSHDVWCGVG